MKCSLWGQAMITPAACKLSSQEILPCGYAVEWNVHWSVLVKYSMPCECILEFAGWSVKLQRNLIIKAIQEIGHIWPYMVLVVNMGFGWKNAGQNPNGASSFFVLCYVNLVSNGVINWWKPITGAWHPLKLWSLRFLQALFILPTTTLVPFFEDLRSLVVASLVTKQLPCGGEQKFQSPRYPVGQTSKLNFEIHKQQHWLSTWQWLWKKKHQTSWSLYLQYAADQAHQSLNP